MWLGTKQQDPLALMMSLRHLNQVNQPIRHSQKRFEA